MTYPTKPRRRSLLTAATAALLAGLVLTGCANPAAPDSSSPSSGNHGSDGEFLVAHDLAGLDAAQVIERLDTMPVAERPTNLLASVEPDALVLTDDQDREARLPMPEDEVYVSVAPYVKQTHECYFHSLTTCIGELGSADVQVVLTDVDGKELINATYETFDNGFVGLWVPEGVEATLTIEYEGRTGTTAITTLNEDDPTCITTLRLT